MGAPARPVTTPEHDEGRPLRVVVVHNRYRSGQPSGEDEVVHRETALLREAGHNVHTFARSSDEIAAMSRTEQAAVLAQAAWSRTSRRQFADRLAAVRPDVVHVHNTFPLISPSILAAAAAADVPVVATLHHYRQICPSGELFRAGQVCRECVNRLPLPAIRHRCYRDSRAATVPLVIAQVVGRRAWWNEVSVFFCISAAQRDTLIAGGMPADRLVVKHNFVPDLGTRTGPGRHVLYLGRLAENKGVQVLMAAWERFATASAPGAPLVIAGDGPLRAAVQRWAATRPDVRFEGLVDRGRCTDLTRAAIAVVVPSVWPEPFGLVAVEAMSLGVPVLASALGSFPELVCAERTGLLHPPGDADALALHLRRVVDSDTSRRLGDAARRRYEEHFNPQVGLRRLVGGYRVAIAARRGRG